MSPRKRHIQDTQNMTVEEFYRSCISIPADTLLNAIYPCLADEWRDCDSNLLFSSWLCKEYSELVAFVRSLSPTEKIELMIAIANEE